MSYRRRARGDLGTGIDVAVDRVGSKKRRLLTVWQERSSPGDWRKV